MLDQAEECIEKAIARAELRPGFYLFRARLHYRSSGKTADAQEDLAKIRALCPTNYEYDVPDEELLTGRK